MPAGPVSSDFSTTLSTFPSRPPSLGLWKWFVLRVNLLTYLLTYLHLGSNTKENLGKQLKETWRTWGQEQTFPFYFFLFLILRQDDPPFAGTTAGTQPKCGNGGVSDAVTSELGDRQSSHPVKNHASIFWQVFSGVARCCLPRFQGQPQHLKYQNWIKKMYITIINFYIILTTDISNKKQ